MLASPRFRSDSPAAGGRRLRLRLAVAVLLLFGLAVGSVAIAAEGAAQGRLGDQIHERFRVSVEDETIYLRPIERDSAIRSIELEDGKEEASVNGKAFSGEELRAFLGHDGELIAELAALDAEERRAELGLNGDEHRRRVEIGSGTTTVIPGSPWSSSPADPADSRHGALSDRERRRRSRFLRPVDPHRAR